MPQAAAPNAEPDAPGAAKTTKPLWRRWWVITLVVVFVLIIMGALAGGDEDDPQASAAPSPTETTPEPEPTTPSPSPSPTPSEEPTPEPTPEPAEPTPEPATAPEPEPANDDAAASAAFEQAIKDGLFVEDFSELLAVDPTMWGGYISGVRVERDLGYVTLQISSNDPGRDDMGQRAARALSTLLPASAVEDISWIIVEDASGVVIAQEQPNPIM